MASPSSSLQLCLATGLGLAFPTAVLFGDLFRDLAWSLLIWAWTLGSRKGQVDFEYLSLTFCLAGSSHFSLTRFVCRTRHSPLTKSCLEYQRMHRFSHDDWSCLEADLRQDFAREQYSAVFLPGGLPFSKESPYSSVAAYYNSHFYHMIGHLIGEFDRGMAAVYGVLVSNPIDGHSSASAVLRDLSKHSMVCLLSPHFFGTL